MLYILHYRDDMVYGRNLTTELPITSYRRVAIVLLLDLFWSVFPEIWQFPQFGSKFCGLRKTAFASHNSREHHNTTVTVWHSSIQRLCLHVGNINLN